MSVESLKRLSPCNKVIGVEAVLVHVVACEGSGLRRCWKCWVKQQRRLKYPSNMKNQKEKFENFTVSTGIRITEVILSQVGV